VRSEDLEGVVRGYCGIGADLVCDASGASRPLEIALRLTRPDGQVTKVGWSPDTIPVDVNPLVQRNLRLQGSFSHNYPVWERVIQLLDRGVTLPETIVGLRAPLEQWRDAFDAMHEGRVIKSVLLPQ
jgi:alcohol dehydrogenase/L-iditol 2-dehydrogenase